MKEIINATSYWSMTLKCPYCSKLESLECTFSAFSRTVISFLPSTTAIEDCQGDASCSLNRAVDRFTPFKEHKKQNEIKRKTIIKSVTNALTKNAEV